MAPMRAAVVFVVGCLAACVRIGEHRCATDEDCSGGVCGVDHRCSFPDIDAPEIEGDRDGDGFPDGRDNCPDIANNQHDDDGDGAGDVCDDCPHVVDTDHANADGDDLGDLCDPRLGGAPNLRVLFDPLTEGSAASWSGVGTPTFTGDAMHLTGLSLVERGLDTQGAPVVVVTAATVERAVAADTPMLGVVGPTDLMSLVACGAIDDPDALAAYGAILEGGTTQMLGRFAGPLTAGTTVAVSFTPPLPGEPAVCSVTAGGMDVLTGTRSTMASLGDRIGLATQGADVAFAYLFVYTR